MHLRSLLISLVVLAALPAAAHADTVIAPAPDAASLAAGGGYYAWLEAFGGDWKLAIRAPDGTITRPDVAPLATATQLSIGSTGSINPSDRKLSVVYGRGGDLYRFDVKTKRESKIAAISSTSYRETAAIPQYGSYVFVRRGGSRPGIYRYRPGSTAVRVTSETPSLVASNGSRVAYAIGRRISVRPLSGTGKRITFRSPRDVRSVTLTRYRVGWLADGGRVYQSERFGGSGPSTTTVADAGKRDLPETANSIATNGSDITTYLDGEAVKRIAPPLFG
jgi:hypothetical protein